MEEWIKKSDAIEAIKDHSFALGDDYLEINGYGAIDDIRALPSADRWIPCSERMPHIYSRYLVTTKIFDNNVVETNIWDDEEQRWCWIGEVLAWMPLPEPWRGADNEP